MRAQNEEAGLVQREVGLGGNPKKNVLGGGACYKGWV